MNRDDLDKCDKALINKPTLASIYDSDWRHNLRQRILGSNTTGDDYIPFAYKLPFLMKYLNYPEDFQQRIEDGVAIMSKILSERDWKHLVARMRGKQCLSAVDEILLARGFALEFGADALMPPPSNCSCPRPEFIVRIGELDVDVEANKDEWH